MTVLPFTKMHGLGNDYVYLDGRVVELDDPGAWARVLSDRRVCIGADGLILVLPPSPGVAADVRMRMFNADGSEAEMCGNGIRCVAKYAFEAGITQACPMSIETAAGVRTAIFDMQAATIELVTIQMGVPSCTAGALGVGGFDAAERLLDRPLSEGLALDAGTAWASACGLCATWCAVSVGNPHVILFCDDPAVIPLETVGPQIEHTSIFPNRVNVHFARIRDRTHIAIRTWERGSGETRACGSGAVATAAAAMLTNRTERSLCTELPGGELRVCWEHDTDEALMTASAVEVYRGELSLDSLPSTLAPPRITSDRAVRADQT